MNHARRPSSSFTKHNRSQPAHDAEHRVDAEFRGMDQPIAGDVKQGIVAQHQVQDHPGRGGAQDRGAQHRRVQIAHDFFEREQHAAMGVLNAAASAAEQPTGTSAFTRSGAEAEPSARSPRPVPAPMCTDGPSRPKRDAARQRRRAAEELPQYGAKRDAARR